MRKLYLAAEVNMYSGLEAIIRTIRGAFISEIPVLAYHRIMDVKEDYPFDVDLVSATPDMFKKQMEFIKKNFNPITMQQFIASLDGGEKLPKRPVLVTFDDGFKDNYSIAYPILRELDIPATIFVATDFISSDETIWFDKLAFFFNRIDASEIKIPKLNLTVNIENSMDARRDCYTRVIEKLKLVDNSLRLLVLEELYAQYGDVYKTRTDEESALSEAMTWTDLKEMSENGISIGSHSVTHPILSMLNPNELSYEIDESKKMLENQLAKPIDSIAYPVGQYESYTKEVVSTIKNSGYIAAFSYVPGISKRKSLEHYSIKRLHVDLDNTLAMFKSKISLPEIFNE